MRATEDGVDITARVALAGLAVALAVLVATGAWLTFNYQPGVDEPIRHVHRATAWLVLPLPLLLPAVAAVRRRPGLVAAGALVAVAVPAASFSGYLLPWDQLGLWAVVVGTDMKGVLDPFGNSVRFVIIGGAEVANETYRRWAVVHLVVLPALALAATAVVARGFLLRR